MPPRKGGAPSSIPWCSSYWKRSLLVTLDYIHQLYFIYVYMKACVYGFMFVLIKKSVALHVYKLNFHLTFLMSHIQSVRSMEKYWIKCIAKEGDYVEKQIFFIDKFYSFLRIQTYGTTYLCAYVFVLVCCVYVCVCIHACINADVCAYVCAYMYAWG